MTPERQQAWQEVLVLERELSAVSEERERLKGEIAVRMVVIKEPEDGS